MANTYTQIYIHLIFAVKGRESLIPREYKSELQKYITGVITNQKNKLIAIENEPDHIHILIGLRPDKSPISCGTLSRTPRDGSMNKYGYNPNFDGKRDSVRSHVLGLN